MSREKNRFSSIFEPVLFSLGFFQSLTIRLGLKARLCPLCRKRMTDRQLDWRNSSRCLNWPLLTDGRKKKQILNMYETFAIEFLEHQGQGRHWSIRHYWSITVLEHFGHWKPLEYSSIRVLEHKRGHNCHSWLYGALGKSLIRILH